MSDRICSSYSMIAYYDRAYGQVKSGASQPLTEWLGIDKVNTRRATKDSRESPTGNTPEDGRPAGGW